MFIRIITDAFSSGIIYLNYSKQSNGHQYDKQSKQLPLQRTSQNQQSQSPPSFQNQHPSSTTTLFLSLQNGFGYSVETQTVEAVVEEERGDWSR